MLVHEGMLRAAEADPGRPAVVSGAGVWSYGELAAAVRRCASSLAGAGLRRGERVAVALPNCPEFLISFLAVAGGGWVAVTAGGPETAVPRMTLREPRQVRRLLAGGGVAAPSAVAADPFYVGYTSGSTGRPRGVVRRHAAWTASFAAADRVFGIGPASRFVVAGPMAFSANLFFALETLNAGGTLHLHARFEAGAIAAGLRGGTDAAFLVPSMYRALLARGVRGEGVRCLISCGEKLDAGVRAGLAAAFPSARVAEFYGSSEIGFTTVAGADDPPESVGRPFPGVEVRVRRPDGSPAACGETGRLYARSAMMADGYDGGPGVVEPFADEEGWASAGDLAWVGADGCVRLAGRGDALINTAGAKVHPAEVEAVLLGHPAVAEAAAFGCPHPGRGQEVVAAVVPRQGVRLAASDLRVHCARRLPPHKRPRRFLVLREMPRTASGKVDRAALREAGRR